MNKTILWGIIILVGVAAGWMYFNGDLNLYRTNRKTSPKTSESTPLGDGSTAIITDEASITGDTKGGVGDQFLFTFTDSGFQPKELTVKKGDTVSFVNQSASAMWVASAVHPTHQVLPGFDQKKSVGKGGTYMYTFEKAGTWKFHNHMAPEMVGTVIVK